MFHPFKSLTYPNVVKARPAALPPHLQAEQTNQEPASDALGGARSPNLYPNVVKIRVTAARGLVNLPSLRPRVEVRPD